MVASAERSSALAAVAWRCCSSARWASISASPCGVTRLGCGETGRSGSGSMPPVSSSLTKARLMAATRSDRFAAAADRAQVLVDAEHDQNEFGDDPREQDADRYPEQAAEQHEHADPGAGRHHLQR